MFLCANEPHISNPPDSTKEGFLCKLFHTSGESEPWEAKPFPASCMSFRNGSVQISPAWLCLGDITWPVGAVVT